MAAPDNNASSASLAPSQTDRPVRGRLDAQGLQIGSRRSRSLDSGTRNVDERNAYTPHRHLRKLLAPLDGGQNFDPGAQVRRVTMPAGAQVPPAESSKPGGILGRLGKFWGRPRHKFHRTQAIVSQPTSCLILQSIDPLLHHYAMTLPAGIAPVPPANLQRRQTDSAALLGAGERIRHVPLNVPSIQLGSHTPSQPESSETRAGPSSAAAPGSERHKALQELPGAIERRRTSELAQPGGRHQRRKTSEVPAALGAGGSIPGRWLPKRRSSHNQPE
ncbi:hypothetical protein P389DRAFT_196597 [Cystobasidium minutum MCA 4210]|uniref:uncharacterized protein n=1 Tax=Cystobasidium minutum MCA 4210 TaxID=1397322 RepID=UPI0034CFE4D7|eukprot:jgi/Rhomi1/196597/gm1.4811_g